MADEKITALTAITGASLADTDVLVVVDVGAPSVTKKVTRAELFQYTPDIVVSTTTPTMRLLEEDGTAGFNGSRLYRSADVFGIQTMNDAAVVSTDYTMTTNAAGATAHTWRIASVEVARFTGTGLGIGTTAPVALLDVAGNALARGNVFANQPNPVTYAIAATLTAADLLSNIIRYTGAVANLTLPLATGMEAGMPFTGVNNVSFEFSIINTGAGNATLVANTGFTIIGAAVVAAGTSGRYSVRRTSATTYIAYRLA